MTEFDSLAVAWRSPLWQTVAECNKLKLFQFHDVTRSQGYFSRWRLGYAFSTRDKGHAEGNVAGRR